MGKASVRFADYGGETSNLSVKIADLTAANFDAKVTAFGSLRTALEGICFPLQYGHFIGNDTVVVEAPQADDAESQREKKWLVRFHDSAGAYTCTIPCADLSVLDPTNRDFMLIASGPGQTFVTAFEALVVGDSGAVTVDSVQFVGRNT